MKKLSMLIILLTVQAFAADLNLNSGETAIIRANVDTKVSCSGSGSGAPSNCQDAIQTFRGLMNSCIRSYDVNYCLQQQWPFFKSENPTCKYTAVATCVEFCTKSYDINYCQMSACK